MANIDKRKSKKLKPIIIVLLLDIIFIPILAYVIYSFIQYNFEASNIIMAALKKPLNIYNLVIHDKNMMILFLILQSIPIIVILNVIVFPNKVNLKDTTDTMRVANFEIPKPVGKGQMGTSRFTTEEEKKKIFKVWKEGSHIDSGGMILGSYVEKNQRYYLYDDDDVNTLIIGTTRSGKSRREYLPSIYLLANSGESMFFSDPKGELFIYTYPYLKEKGYKVYALDFESPEKGIKYNYLKYIIKAVNENNINKAIQKTWDLVSIFVPEPKNTEPLWSNGEAAVIASAILYICLEAPDEKYKNLTNVYYFLREMCKADGKGKMPITKIMDSLPVTHPARSIFGVAEIAPERTRGSFFTSTLATLRLFADTNIADMTSTESDSEIDIVNELATEKVAIFCIAPDEKTTYYPLIKALVDQTYMELVSVAKEHGGRLPKRVNMLLDEFGNFPQINSFQTKLTVCLGRGIRFILAVQGIAQLNDVYGDKVAKIITSNCHDWIYLLTSDPETSEMISKKTGTYTVQTKSVSSSTSNKSNVNYSSSAQVTKRNLLTPDEVERLDMPYSLVFKARELPSVFNLPDLSKQNANEKFGMGDKEHNIKITIERQENRKKRIIDKNLDIWLPIMAEKLDIDNSNEFENINDINFSDNNDSTEEDVNFI